MGDTFVKILIVEYAIIVLAYLWQKDYPKVLYFIGAIILTVGVLSMK